MIHTTADEIIIQEFTEIVLKLRNDLPVKKIVLSREYYDRLERAFKMHQNSLPYTVNLPIEPRVLKLADVEIRYE